MRFLDYARPENIPTQVVVVPTEKDQVSKYRFWLQRLSQYKDPVAERQAYTSAHIHSTSTFAPYYPETSAYTTSTIPQQIVIGLILFVSAALLLSFGFGFLVVCIALVTALYVVQLTISALLLFKASSIDVAEKVPDHIIRSLANASWPKYTIFCPLYKDAVVVPQLLKAIHTLDYPKDKLEVLLLVEESDKQTRAAIQQIAPPPYFKMIMVPEGQPRTKPRACNYGLLFATGQYCVIFDAEDNPTLEDPYQLKKAVLTFANHGPKLACVQGKLNFYNPRQNLLTRMFTIEYTTWFDIILPALWCSKMALPLGGTSNHFQTSILRVLGGWDAFNVTEDADLGFRLAQQGFETAVVEATTYEEANSLLGNWLRQRSRWTKGYMQTYLAHMRHPLKTLKKKQGKSLLSLQFVVGAGSCTFFINPVMWLLTAIYIVFRMQVEATYQVLFPWPVLYAGAFCMIFGNVFWIITAMVACMKREQYELVPFCLLLPFYWLLMCIAAFKGGWQLLTRPHYWEKTKHGLHLKGQQNALVAAEQDIKAHSQRLKAVMPVAAPRQRLSVTEKMLAIVTLPVAVVRGDKARREIKPDWWLISTFIVSSICSISATIYSFIYHDILLYDDAYSRMRISRSVFDSFTPGLAQLGGVWLPLPHILMWPFVWNDYLWRSGLAGAFIGTFCYIVTAGLTFLTAQRLTKNNAASFVGTLVFVFNLNVLYVQTTPLSELVCIVTFAAAMYFFLLWVQEGADRYLILTACSALLATLARYDGWALFAALFVLVPLINIIKRRATRRVIAHSLLFSILGGLGIVLWLLWNKMIFGDPLYFQRGPYSSQHQTNRTQLYHDIYQSIRYETALSLQTIGIGLCVAALIGLLWFIIRNRISDKSLQALVFFVPYTFYVLAYYIGEVEIRLPSVNPPGVLSPFFNARFGTQIVPSVAIGVAILISIPLKVITARYWRAAILVLCFVALIFQYTILFQQVGVISLRDGQMNYACNPSPAALNYLTQHYEGGEILEDTTSITGSSSLYSAVQWSGLDIKDFIYQGSGQYWNEALKNPDRFVNWIVVNPRDPIDLIAKGLNLSSPSFTNKFQLEATQLGGIEVFHLRGQPLIPIHPAPVIWNIPHDPC